MSRTINTKQTVRLMPPPFKPVHTPAHLQQRQVQLPEAVVAACHDALHLPAVLRKPHAHVTHVGQAGQPPEQILRHAVLQTAEEGSSRAGS
jgi:hypothetical protein